MTRTATKRRSAPVSAPRTQVRATSLPSARPGAGKPDPVMEFLRLIWALDHNMHVTSKRMAGRHGITGPQRLVVRLIGQQPEVSGGELAHALHVHKSTITGIVQRLEGRGLVRRATDAADARRIRLTLTAAGRKVSGPLPGTVEAAVRRTLAASDSKTIDAARRVIERLAQELAGGK